jgi:predicted nucleic acid-binding Zn ribbon protein
MEEWTHRLRWHAPDPTGEGLAWIRSEPLEDWVLVAPPGLSLRDYDPMGEPALFLLLAATPIIPDGVLSFANRWGLLGLRRDHVFHSTIRQLDVVEDGERRQMANKLEALRQHLLPGQEPFHWWRWAITWMDLRVQLWKCANAGDTDGLSQLVRWAGPHDVWVHHSFGPLYGDRSVYKRDSDGNRVYSAPGNPVLLSLSADGIAAGDQVGLARWVLARELHAQLSDCRAGMTWERQTGRPRLRIGPRSLWAALVLQLALAVDQDAEFRQCAACGKWFPISPGVSRVDRKTCSDACRTKLHREKKKAQLNS